MTSRPPKKLVIKSNNTELSKVESFIRVFFTEYGIANRFFNKVFLCISEAVINSIEHGNRNDTNKEISIYADCESKTIVVKIKDEGEGFDLNSVPNPTKKENLLKESGRGIHIIKSLADKIECDKNIISILFKIDCK